MSNNIYKKLKLASADARMVKKTEKKGGLYVPRRRRL